VRPASACRLGATGRPTSKRAAQLNMCEAGKLNVGAQICRE
jgi:hypothetical protein